MKLRAISLVPSATDALVALGAGDALVGISSDCDQPDPSRPLPVVTGAVIDPAADPAVIDSAVRQKLAEGRSLYELAIDTIVSLAPQVVFAQDQCAVCAVPSGAVRAALGAHGLVCDVVSLDPVGLGEVLSTFAPIGHAVGAGEAGESLESSCRRRLRDLDWTRLPGGRRPRVLVLDWVDPPFAAGNWVPELVEAAGGEPVVIGREQEGPAAGGALGGGADAGGGGGGEGRAASTPAPSRQVTVDEVVAARPDIVVVAPCGLGLEASADAARVVAGWFGSGPAAGSTAGSVGTAARGDEERPRVVAFEGRIWFSRPGPRLVEGAETLSALLRGKDASAFATEGVAVEIT